MEETKQEPANNEQPVMDVKPPESPVPEPPAAEQPQPTDASAPAKGLSPELLAQAQAESGKPTEPKLDEKQKHDDKNPLLSAHAPKKGGRKVVVVVAVVIALALAGLAVYAYTQSNGSSDNSTHDSSQEHSDSSTQPATAHDVEDAAKELDNTVNATNEAQEIPSDGMTEDAVGL